MPYHSKRVHGWWSASSIDLRVKKKNYISNFHQLSRYARLSRRREQTEKIGRCGGAGAGVRLLTMRRFPSRLHLAKERSFRRPLYFNSAARRALLNAAPRVRGAPATDVSENDAVRTQRLLIFGTYAGFCTSRHLFGRWYRRFTGSGGRSHRRQASTRMSSYL